MQSQPIDFHPPAEEAAPFLLPHAGSLFGERAERFEQLATGHVLGDWLRFLGAVSRAQQNARSELRDLALPGAERLELAAAHAMPPLDPAARPVVWRDVLRAMVAELAEQGPAPTRAALADLQTRDDAALEALADQLIHGAPTEAALASLPFVAAALQVVYSELAGRLHSQPLQKLDAAGVCPCCGSHAVASIVRLGSAINNLRYLHCSLCNTEWNVPRAVCSACDSEQGVALHEVAGAAGPVRAETCDSCKSYLKIVYQEKDPQVDPVADDLASLALDMLLDDAGFERAGPNLFLIGAAAP